MTHLEDRINEFFSLQGFGLEEYLNSSVGRDEAEAEDCFLSDLSFGTAGLRAEMGVGFNRMNEVTVRIATMGIAAYLKESDGPSRIVIGYDHRRNSRIFAEAAYKIFKSYGHEVRMFPRMVPTPFVPSAIQCGRFGFGVMITASHNPKDDNGYKVYAGNGAQIQDQLAKTIAEFIKRERGLYREKVEQSSLIEPFVDDEELLRVVSTWYLDKLRVWIKPERLIKTSPEKFVYTALHGVGADYLDMIFEFLFKGVTVPYYHVEEQRGPDSAFPTVRFPNPEEGGATLKLAMERGDQLGIKIVFANDPDADRFCVAESEGNGCWRIFNGNEIAVLLADYISGNCNLEGKEKRYVMLASCVSSRFLGHFCSTRGWHFESTPTGFKNLGNRAIELLKGGFFDEVLLSYEEAIGFQVGSWNFDKDGLTSLTTFFMLLNEPESTARSLAERLEAIYLREKCWPVQCNGYYFCRPVSKIKTLLSKITSAMTLPFSDATIKNEGEGGSTVTIEFEIPSYGPAWLMLRASGTEPKLKYYSELMIFGGDSGPVSMVQAAQVLENAVQSVIDAVLEPEANNLIKK